MRRLLGTLAAGVIALTGPAAPGPAPVAEAGTAASHGRAAAAGTAPAGGSFTVLTYNIAGLPLGLGDSDPAANTPLIGQRLAPYDLVNVQEDFNYHASLYAHDTHPHRTPTSGGAGFGDGLNTLADHSFQDFERVRWKDCAGTDCLTPKGFSLARVRLAEGVHVDLYNVHTNADTTEAALTARRANIEQLSDFIRTQSAGNAVVVMGDTNTRYTRTGDNIRTLTEAGGLTDAWVHLVRGGAAPALGSPALLCDRAAPTDACEVVDKILYRSGPLVRLTAARYGNDWRDFLGDGGKHLSDHYPHSAAFGWSLPADRRAGDLFGGGHGTAFNDAGELPARPRPHTLTLRGGARLDSVALSLGDGTVLRHGGTGGTASFLTLAEGEHLTSVTLSRGRKDGRTRIFSAAFTTDAGRTLSAGSATSDTAVFTAPAGWQITGFAGRAGDEIDKLGVIYAPQEP